MFGWMRRLSHCTLGSVAPTFALLLVPLLLTSGMAVDYGTASMRKTQLQSAVDAAVLAGVGIPSGPSRDALAAATLAASMTGSLVPASKFATNSDASYTGTATITVPTTLMAVAGIKSVTVSATATAISQNTDSSCILALGKTYSATSSDTITFNGIPNLNLMGCGIRSNQSIVCNGHDSNATVSQAVGTVSGCSHPQSDTAAPDFYANLASYISKSAAARTSRSVGRSVQFPPAC